MAGRMRAAVIALVTTGLLVLGMTPALARFGRTAAEAINPTEACSKYLSLEVASMAPDEGPNGPVVTIQAYAPASEFRNPAALVLERTIPVREVFPPLTPLATADPPDPSEFPFHGRAVLRWNVGRLSPGTTIAVTTPDAGGDFVPVTFSKRCDPPNVRLSRTCSTTAGVQHTWRVRNPEAVAVDFNAEVLGTRPARVEIGTAPANGTSEPFQTQVPGPDIVVLFVGGIPVDVAACLR
jgi:hypothetical protein